jgi:hypothetical protein
VCVSPYTLSHTHSIRRGTQPVRAHTHTWCQRERGARGEQEGGAERKRKREQTHVHSQMGAVQEKWYEYISHTHTHTHTHAKVGAVQVLRNGKVGWGVPKAGDSQVIVDDTQYRTSIHNTAIPYFDTQYRNSVLRYTIPRAHRRMHKPTYVHTHKI